MAVLSDGYSDVPPGKVASIVTSLEMYRPFAKRAERNEPTWELERELIPNVHSYKKLYRSVGSNWLWFSRLFMPEEELTHIIHHPDIEVCVFKIGGKEEGLLELDFRQAGTCELVYLGLTDEAIGQGVGRWLMNRAFDRVDSRGATRFWVHTCTLDHPNALDFYLRTGFTAFRRQIEIADDPRFLGKLPTDAAPHIPRL